MAVVFYVIGWLVIIGGAALGGFSVYSVAQAAGSANLSSLGALYGAAVGPSVGIMVSGLMFLAIGGVLARLDRIVYNTMR